jgi:hypothetical protein
MMTNEATLLCAGGLPAGRSERCQIVLIGQAGQAGEGVAQVGERVLAVALAGDDRGVEDGRALAGGKRPPECLQRRLDLDVSVRATTRTAA